MYKKQTCRATGDDAVATGSPVDAGDSLRVFREHVYFIPLPHAHLIDVHLIVIRRDG